MNWLKDFVTPKIKAFIGTSSNIDENLWTKCPSCERMIYTKELENNLMVCGYCSHHFSISNKARFESIFDNKDFEEIDIVSIKDDRSKRAFELMVLDIDTTLENLKSRKLCYYFLEKLEKLI